MSEEDPFEPDPISPVHTEIPPSKVVTLTLQDRVDALERAAAKDERINASIASTQRQLEGRIVELERRAKGATEAADRASRTAEGAARQAAQSIQDLEGISLGLKAHMEIAEKARAQEAAFARSQAEATEAERKKGAAAHAKRFDALGAGIATLNAAVASIDKAKASDRRLQWVLAALVALATIVGNQVVEVIKVSKAPPVATPAVYEPPHAATR